jgi:hypothetical protein
MPAETSRGHALEVSTGAVASPSRSATGPLLLALGGLLLFGGAVAALGLGAWRIMADPAPATSASAATLSATRATGGAPAREPGNGGSGPGTPDVSVGGSPPVIVPSDGDGRSPFEGLVTAKGGASSRAPDAKAPRKNESPATGSGGRAQAEPVRAAQCYRDPFTGAIKAVKGNVPANVRPFACKYNPFNGQYQRL